MWEDEGEDGKMKYKLGGAGRLRLLWQHNQCKNNVEGRWDFKHARGRSAGVRVERERERERERGDGAKKRASFNFLLRASESFLFFVIRRLRRLGRLLRFGLLCRIRYHCRRCLPAYFCWQRPRHFSCLRVPIIYAPVF